MSDNIYNPINENTISITDKNDDPVIDSNQSCYDPLKDITIYDCVLSDDGLFISGITDTGMKARYSYKKHKWFYGRDIGTSNLIDFTEREEAEKYEIIKKSHEKARENREQKKNFNELAKAMLEQVVSNKVINNTLDDTGMMLDNTYGSLILGAMIQGAMNGSFKCAEFVRDTAGYKPESKSSIDLSADIMTDADRSLLDKLSKRIG